MTDLGAVARLEGLDRAADDIAGMLARPLAFFDLETTGTSTKKDRIVEFAYFIVHPSGNHDMGLHRFNPGIPIPKEASDVHGITDEDVAGEPTFASFASTIEGLLSPCDLAGYNIRRFDVPLLLEELKRAGRTLRMDGRRLIDLQVIFFRENPRNLTAAVRRYLGRAHDDAHAADSDVEVCIEILAAQVAEHGLPRDAEGLHAYCDETHPYRTEVEEWFDMSGPVPVFRKSKHKGEPVNRVPEGFLKWMLRLDDLGPEVKAIAQNALMGTYR